MSSAAAVGPPGAAEVIELLVQQHRLLEGLLAGLTASDSAEAAETTQLLRQVAEDLSLHLSAEEQCFYPAVHAAGTESILLESLEEHLSLKRLLADLLALPVADQRFRAKCQVLEEQARHHHQEEEDKLFPEVRRHLDPAARQELGAELVDYQQAMRLRGSAEAAVQSQTDAAAPLLERGEGEGVKG